MKEGNPPVMIKVESQSAYYETLEKAHMIEDYSDFIALVEVEMKESLVLHVQAIK